MYLLNSTLKLSTILILVFSINSCREKDMSVNPNDDPSIINQRSKIYISSPEKYELWRQNSVYTITWAPYANQTKVRLELLKKGVVRHIIDEETENDGVYIWNIPNNIQNSNMYYIKIIKLDNPNYSYTSDDFSIRNF